MSVREESLLWLIVVGFTLAVWVFDRLKAAQARRRRPPAPVRAPVPIPLPVTTAVERPPPVPRPPPLPAVPLRSRPARRHEPAARRRRRHPRLTRRTLREGMVLAAILGPCKGLD